MWWIDGDIYSLTIWSDISAQFCPILSFDHKTCLILCSNNGGFVTKSTNLKSLSWMFAYYLWVKNNSNWMKADWMKEQSSSTVELEPTQLGSSSLLIFDCSNHLIIKNEIKHEFPFKNPPKTPLKVVKIIRKRAK